MAVEVREIPTLPAPKVLNRRSSSNWSFGIYQQDGHVTVLARPHRRAEPVESLLASAAGYDARTAIRGRQLQAIAGKSLFAPLERVFIVSPALHVDSDAHQRFPPISPLIQRCPSE